MNSEKVEKHHFLSFRRKPESSLFNWLQNFWTPVFTGVTTFYETIKIDVHVKRLFYMDLGILFNILILSR